MYIVHNPVFGNANNKENNHKGINQMKYFDIKKDGKLIGRVVPTIHISGIVDVDDLEKTIVGIDKILTEVSLEHYADKIAPYLGQNKESVMNTYMKKIPDSYHMDMWYMLKGSEGLETVDGEIIPINTLGTIDKIFASLFKDNNFEGIKFLLKNSNEEMRELLMRDIHWRVKILKSMQSSDITLIAVGAGHVIRDAFDVSDMSILEMMELMDYEVVEVTL